MATQFKHDGEKARAFAEELLNLDSLLPSAVDWMQTHMDPGDVFSREQLDEWARAAGYVPPG